MQNSNSANFGGEKSEAIPSITPSKCKATSWIITLNNPTADELIGWENVKQNHFVKEAVGQIEKGEEGTPHIQGYLRTDSVRFSQIKKLFPRAHIEVAKNAIATKQYCQKTDTRVEKLVTTELNTSIHQAVYEETINWWRHNKLSTEENGNFTARDEVKSREWAISVGLPQCGFLSESIREKIYDTAISNMIISGVKHIEFIAVNNLTRSAFKKYFPALIIRENGYVKERERLEKERKESETSISQQTLCEIEDES